MVIKITEWKKYNIITIQNFHQICFAFTKYSAEDLDKIVSKLNDLERKKLNYYTPYMKILEEYDSIEGTELLFNLQTAVNS